MVGKQGDWYVCQWEGKWMGRWVGRVKGGYVIG